MPTTYDAFLASCDPVVWSACLADRERALAEGGPPDLERIVEGLCIAGYSRWLARLTGDGDDARRTRQSYDRFVAALADPRVDDRAPLARRGWGIVLGFDGYRSAAQSLLAEMGPLTVELAVHVAPDDHAARAALLRPFVKAGATRPFPPARYFYCAAQINLGAIHEARAILASAAKAGADPLVWELLGRIHEREGRWAEALAAYDHSTWPEHRYRAAICRVIEQGGSSATAGTALDADHEALRKALTIFEPEIDRAEIARSAAFVNACLWNAFEDWLVQFELGKLHFRRRRYAEADTHLRRALTLAPESCRFPIADLRFVNLTWLTGNSLSNALSMEPEALESAFDALLAGPHEPTAATIRLWLASKLPDPAHIPADIESWDPYDRAEAHEIIGNTDEAIACRLLAMREDFRHRNLLGLLKSCTQWRLEKAAEFLLRTIERESWSDFFALHELADHLVATPTDPNATSSGRDHARLDTIMARILELSQFEFQHLIRAHDLLVHIEWRDAAEDVLRRAAELAEGAAENLAVAVARRRSTDFDPARGDPDGLACLLRAERESRDRLERLQIARELFIHGRTQQARRILVAEGVFAAETSFEPIEYVAALQCRQSLEAEEVRDLVHRAYAAAIVEIESGGIVHCPEKYLERLRRIDRDVPENQVVAGMTETTTTWLPAGPWAEWTAAIQKRLDELGDDPEPARFAAEISRFTGPSSTFAGRLAAWGWVHARIEQAFASAANVWPETGVGELPISRNLTLDDDGRAVELSELWRRHLSATGPWRATTRKRLDAFFERERRLVAEWEANRRRLARPHLRRALHYARFAADFLPTIVSDAERDERQPVLRDLYDAIGTDCRRLADRLRELIATIEAALQDDVPLDASVRL